MSYFLIGSNYELSDSETSSKIAFSNQQILELHRTLLDKGLADCAIILSTCNRSELYIYRRNVQDKSAWTRAIKDEVFKLHNLSDDYLAKFYQKLDYEACLHLFKVVSGLDSLVLGEPQITGQIKDAMELTEKVYAELQVKIPAEFYRLINEAFACAKEVRTQTSIGKYAVSIAYMACQIARTLFTDFSNQHILLIGASQTNLLLARHLIRNGIQDFKIINRSQRNGQEFINELGVGKLYEFSELESLLSEATLVFSSTSASDFIVNKELLHKVQQIRNNQEILLFDLAIPNDIDPQVRNIKGVNLYNRDDLQEFVNINKQKRVDAVKDALPILNKYLKNYREHNFILQGNEIIVEYRNSVNQQREKLVAEAKLAIANGEDPLEILENLSTSLMNKILHTPTLILSSFIKNGQTCELNSIHEFIDRKERQNFQNIVDTTLNKEVFKNICCKSLEPGLSGSCCSSKRKNEFNIFEIEEYSVPDSSGIQIYKSLASEIREDSQVKKCPIDHSKLDSEPTTSSERKCPFAHGKLESNTTTYSNQSKSSNYLHDNHHELRSENQSQQFTATTSTEDLNNLVKAIASNNN